MISLFSVYQQTERKKLIAAKLSADVFWVIHYLFRELVFLNRENKAWANKIIWPILFILCGWGMGIYTFRSALNILPIVASTLVTVSLWIKNPRLTKLITVPVCAAFMIYDFYVGSWIGIINEALSICSIIISFAKEKIKAKEQSK